MLKRNEKRIGKFVVKSKLLTEAKDGVSGANVFRGFIPLEVTKIDGTRTEMLGYHEQFEAVKNGEDIPYYDAEFNKTSSTPQWVRIFDEEKVAEQLGKKGHAEYETYLKNKERFEA